MLAEFIAARVAKGCSLTLDVAEHYLHLYCRFWLRAFLLLVTSVEDVLTTIFDWESRILLAPSCGVYTPQESAIVVIGGEAGLGQGISLYLSELGYTVFALCPNLPASCSATTQATKSSDVSSLLYAWHKRKKRSIHTSWGLVAPISCDMSSEEQRTHAFETVHAYCTKHSLKLTALIVLSPTSTAKRKDLRHWVSDWRTHLEPRDVRSPPPWSSSNDLSLVEAAHVVEAYIGMLSKASGRMIILAYGQRDCYFCQPVALLNGVGQLIARNFNRYLEALGIRAIFISVGPVAPPVREDPTDAQSTIQCAVDAPCSRLHGMLSDLLGTCVVEHDAFCEHIRQIITSRYPRYSYSVGLYPFLDSIRLAMPDVLRQLLKSCL